MNTEHEITMQESQAQVEEISEGMRSMAQRCKELERENASLKLALGLKEARLPTK